MRPFLPLALAIALGLPVAAQGEGGIAFPYTVTDGREIAEPLGGRTGDAARGAELYTRAPLPGCLSCHGNPTRATEADEQAPADAPDLAQVGARLSAGEIRLWIVAPEAIDPYSPMPGFYLAGQRPDPDAPVINGPALTAQEIEDLVAFLVGLSQE